MAGTAHSDISLSVPLYTMAYLPNGIRFLLQSGFGVPVMILEGLYGPEIPTLDGKAFSHCWTFLTSPFVMSLVCVLYGRAWHIDLARSLKVRMHLSIFGTCSLAPQMCNLMGINEVLISSTSNSLSP